MAQVPYSPLVNVRPQGSVPERHLDVPANAFGLSIAQAVGHLGEVAQHAGDELFARAQAMQDLTNRADADKLVSEYAEKSGKVYSDYLNTEGKNAVDGYEGYTSAIKATRAEVGDKATNPMVKRLYDSESRSSEARSIFSGARHAGDQGKKYIVGEMQGRQKSAFEELARYPDDPTANGEALKVYRDTTAQQAAIEGWGPEKLKATQDAAESTALSTRIKAIAAYEPFRAEKMLEENKAKLDGKDFDVLQNIVRTNTRAVAPQNYAQEVWDAKKPLADMEAEAEKIAKERSKDPMMPKLAVQAVKNLYTTNHYATQQQQITDTHTIRGLVRNPDGTMVKTEQELFAKPEAQALISRLPPEVKNDLPGYINRTNAAATKVSNEQSRMRVWGLANNPETRLQFLEKDLSKEGLSAADQMRFEKLQQTIREHPKDDPQVTRAVRWIAGSRASELEALGIRKYSPDKNADDYNHYLGTLSAAIEAWQGTHGHPPSQKDVVDDIATEVFRNQKVPGFFYGTNDEARFKSLYSQDIPASWRNKFQSDLKAKGVEPAEIANISPEQERRFYVREQLMQLYKAKTGAKDE